MLTVLRHGLYRAALSGWVAKREARNAVTKRGMAWIEIAGPIDHADIGELGFLLARKERA